MALVGAAPRSFHLQLILVHPLWHAQEVKNYLPHL